MALTLRQVASDMLAHINHKLSATTPFSTGTFEDGTLLPFGCEDYLVSTLNLAVEEMRQKCPRLFRQTISVVFGPEVVGTCSATNEGTALTSVAGVVPQNGCTAVVGGDSTYNEIRAATGAGNFTLNHAFGGTTGAQSLAVFGDSRVISASVDQVLGAVAIAGRRPLTVLNSREAFLFFHAETCGDYGQRQPNGLYQIRKVGTPEALWVEAAPSLTGTIEYRVHCAPLPGGRFPVELEALVIPAAIVAADLNTAATTAFPAPGQRYYSIFRALALYHWQACPWYANEKGRKMLDRGYSEAIEQLENFAPDASSTPNIVLEGC